MSEVKVLNLRAHIGGLLGKTSYDSVKDNADMILMQEGVLIKTFRGSIYNILIPFPNIVEARLLLETDMTKGTDKDPTKKQRGRPKKTVGLESDVLLKKENFDGSHEH